MIYGIHRNTTPPAGGIPPRKSAPQAASFRAAQAQTFDQLQLSAQTGDERRALETAARLSQDVRSRPTAGELSALSASIREGSYQPDAREIAARMLLLGGV